MNSTEGCNCKQKQLAIIGFSTRAASQCAKRQGYEVIAIDHCADRDLLAECSLHMRLDDPNWPTILNAKYPCVPLLLAGGMEHCIHLIAQCHSVSKRCGPTGSQIAAMRNLENWEDWACLSEIAWPMTIRNLQGAGRMLKQEPNSRWMLKSMQSAGGSGTTEISSDFELCNPNILRDKNAYIQARLSGESIGVTFLSSEFGCAVVGAAAAWPVHSNSINSIVEKYLYRGSIGPIAMPEELIEKLQRFGSVASIRSGLHGLWQADFLLDQSTLTLLEINPRWSASMELLDVGLNLSLVEMHHDAICSMLSHRSFEEFAKCCVEHLKRRRDNVLGKLIIYANGPMVVTQDQSEYWWAHRWNSIMSDKKQHYFADIPCAGTSISKGEPILTVLTTGNSAESILSVLETAKSTVVVH